MLCAIALFLMCRFFKDADERTVNKILLVFSVCCLAFEVYKQVIFSFDYNGGDVSWDYQWYAFPFQFCSMPMYTALLAVILKKGRVHDALLVFLACYGTLAGILVMAMPGDVFTPALMIDVQTMFHHGSQLVVGLYLLLCKKIKLNFRAILGGALVFIGVLSIALLLDIVFYKTGIIGDETFNMFFISPYFDSTLPVYKDLYQKLPYPVFFALYAVPFVAASSLMFAVRALFDKALTKKRTV